MKYGFHLFFAVLFLSTNALAYEPKIEIVEQFDDLKMIAFLNKADLDKNPEWNPASSAPPLSVLEAIQAVKVFSKKSDLALNEIEIRTVPRHGKQWHYLIKVANESLRSKYSVYVVLMNGVVIPAMIEPEGYK